jgi:CPA1 family monovalent cation:H+ antiporter
MVGIALPTAHLVAVCGLALGAYLIMFAARALPVYALLGLADWRGTPIPWSWRQMTFWGGIRGALSVALALSVATNPQVNRGFRARLRHGCALAPDSGRVAVAGS